MVFFTRGGSSWWAFNQNVATINCNPTERKLPPVIHFLHLIFKSCSIDGMCFRTHFCQMQSTISSQTWVTISRTVEIPSPTNFRSSVMIVQTIVWKEGTSAIQGILGLHFFIVWRSKSFQIRLRMKLKESFEILKFVLNLSWVYVFHTVSR